MKRIARTWRRLGIDAGIPARFARMVIVLALCFLAFECITIEFRWPEQAVLGGLTIAIALAMHSISDSELITLALMFASVLATARYAWWRCSMLAAAVLDPSSDPHRRIGWFDLAFMAALLSAEFYAFGILILGYIQTARPLRRPPVPLPDRVELWPHVDLLIPTYNEPLSVVRSTIFAAMNIDYPRGKLHVYVLDDGRRQEFRDFCGKSGAGYITRADNRHAKAGNINSALRGLDSPFVAIFDCDHVPTRSFLQVTLGWFIKDEKLAMLQTPHHFYSPDPFERNLEGGNAIPNEGELFYGVIQDSSDLWNATFFCGSCAVLRRAALEEIGGIATETVTEDAHTSLRMQMRGWNTAYINIPQAAGLATESLSSHIGQRVRWARGMIQVLRTDNPLFAKNLDWPQRLCYFNSMAHFLYAGPRLLFLTAPLVYMLLGRINIPGDWIAILAYALPHLLLANVANYRIQGKSRHSFWNEVYETVLAPYILGPTLLALVNPKLGKFNVTAKGGIVSESYFDSRIARPYVFLLLLDCLALAVAPFRFFYWNAGHPGTVVMNVMWVLFNMTIIGSANAVAFESRQLRGDVRVAQNIPAEVRTPDGGSIFGRSNDLSLGGASLTLEEPCALPHGSALQVVYPLRHRQAAFAATVVSAQGTQLRLKYEPLSMADQELMTLVLYSRADTWLARSERHETDRPLRSFAHLALLSVKGLGYALGSLLPKRKSAEPASAVRAGSAAALVAMLFAGACAQLRAQSASAPAGGFQSTFTLRDAGLDQAIVFRGVDASRSVPFVLPQSQAPRQGELHLRYSFSPALLSQASHLNVLLNGSLLASLAAPAGKGAVQEPMNADIALPGDLLSTSNVLSFEFIGHYTLGCEDPSNSALWARVETNSSLTVSGLLLPLSDDLGMLPAPFYEDAATGPAPPIPFYFAVPPDRLALEAAGVVASWFGISAKSRTAGFPVSIGGPIPKGNVVLLLAGSGAELPGLGAGIGGGPAIAVRSNPSDPFGKALIVAGEDGGQMLTAARSLAVESALLRGRTERVADFRLPPPRRADDAPFWLSTDGLASLSSHAAGELESDGSGPVPVYLRLPPDLYAGDRVGLPLHLEYRYNAIPLADASTLRVSVNGSLVNELPLPHKADARKTLSHAVDVPLADLQPLGNTFLFNFLFQPASSGYCGNAPPSNLRGAILPSSYLDLRGLNHWAGMPNLALFADAGFPFTRFADLSQTTIVLPPAPSPQEIALYLELLARFGEETGYPALRLSVGDASSLGGDRDYLVLGTPEDQSAFEPLNSLLPVAVDDRGFSVRDAGGLFPSLEHIWWQAAEMRPDWWWKLGSSQQRDGAIASLGESPKALLQGIESPWSGHRSIVAITLTNRDSAVALAGALRNPSASSNIGESVSVLRGGGFRSFRLTDSYYHVGYLPWWSQIRYRLRQFPWLVVVLTFVLGLVVAPWSKARLDRRAQARLRVGET